MTENVEYDVEIYNIARRESRVYDVNLRIRNNDVQVMSKLTRAFKVKLVVEPKPPTERVSVIWALKHRRKAIWAGTNRHDKPTAVHSVTRLGNGTLAVNDVRGRVINHADKDDTVEVLAEGVAK